MVRIRIVMTSIYYIMTGHPGFLNWETVEDLMEYLNDLIFHRLDGGAPDVVFFNRAYLLTMNNWSNELRVADCKLETLVLARTNWSHFWTNYQPSASAQRSEAVTSASYDLSMLPPDLVERVNQVQSLTRALQSKVDKAATGQKRRDEDNGAAKDGKKGKAGNGKGAGNGKWKKWKPRGGRPAKGGKKQ